MPNCGRHSLCPVRGARLSFLVASTAIVLLGTATSSSASSIATTRPAQRAIADSGLSLEVVAGVNALRVQHGLVPLLPSAALTLAAASHSASMGLRGFFSHESADGSAFWNRVNRFYKPTKRESWSVGENLLWSAPSIDSAEAIRLWLASPAHRAVLLAPKWRDIGLAAVHVMAAPGVFNGQDVVIVTADFGVRRP